MCIRDSNKTAAVGDPVPALTQADYTVSGLVGRDTLAKADVYKRQGFPMLCWVA